MARWHSARAAASAASAGRGGSAEAEERLHHPLHLLLAGAAPQPATASFTWLGVYCDDLAPGGRRLGQREPAGLADRHRRAHVDLEEHPLDGDDVGLELGDQRRQLALQLGQALGQRLGRAGCGSRRWPPPTRAPAPRRRGRRSRSGRARGRCRAPASRQTNTSRMVASPPPPARDPRFQQILRPRLDFAHPESDAPRRSRCVSNARSSWFSNDKRAASHGRRGRAGRQTRQRRRAVLREPADALTAPPDPVPDPRIPARDPAGSRDPRDGSAG